MPTLTFFYTNASLEFKIITFFNTMMSINAGPILQRSRTSSFNVSQYTVTNGRISDYETTFSIKSEWNFGYSMGASFERPLTESLSGIFDIKMQVPNLKSGHVDDIFVAGRLGLGYYF